jgi:hypothetical protein
MFKLTTRLLCLVTALFQKQSAFLCVPTLLNIYIDNLLVQLVGPTSKLRKGYDLATIVHSLRQIYFATKIDKGLV